MNYYNEFDKHAAAWLRELIRAGLIPPGDVDERSIRDVKADDLRGYTQCHFFAGIGGWSYALRLAGWPDDRPVWTGSCPCQPFSSAGKQRGSNDERHLWPAFFDLIRECRPASVFGEQVAGAAGYAWFDHVAADLEGEAYAAAACDIGAHSVGAPHLRQRMYWVADADSGAAELLRSNAGRAQACEREVLAGRGNGGMADANIAERRSDVAGRNVINRASARWQQGDGDAGECSSSMGDAGRAGLEGFAGHGDNRGQSRWDDTQPPGSTSSPGVSRDWGGEWRTGADGKSRLIEPSIQPMAHGIPARVVRLRGYGNAVVPQTAAAFIRAYMSTAGAVELAA